MKTIIKLMLILSLGIHTIYAQEDTKNKEAAAPQAEQAEKKKPKKDVDEILFTWTRSFSEVLHYSKMKHYNLEHLEKCMIHSIDAFLNCLDPHSNLLDPKTYKAISESTSGTFFGIGIVIDNTRKTKDKALTIIDIIPDGPADKAGARPYDKIIEIDGKPLEGMTTEAAVVKMRGKRNTKLHIKVMRGEKPDPIGLDIIRDEVKHQNSLCFYLPDHNVYYLQLTSFTDSAVQQIKKLLQKSRKKQYKGLILDLRNNSGGLLTAAISIAGQFLDKGSLVVTTKDKNHKETARYSTKANPVANNKLPIFILINNYTASAAEILAGALKIHSEGDNDLMVFLVGSTTFGKGSVQEVIPISNDCAIKITTSLYFLPNDTTIQGKGIEPDFLIPKSFPAPEQLEWFTKHYGREKTLSNYIKPHGSKDKKNDTEKKENDENKKAQKDKKPVSWAKRAQEILSKDNQFQSSITLANLLDQAKKEHPDKVATRPQALSYLKKSFVTKGTISMQEVKI